MENKIGLPPKSSKKKEILKEQAEKMMFRYSVNIKAKWEDEKYLFIDELIDRLKNKYDWIDCKFHPFIENN